MTGAEPMDELDEMDTTDRLLAMTNLFRMAMERRHARPAGEPTRLQSFLLTAIARHEGAMAASELAPLLDVSAATASQMVGVLEAAAG